MKRSLLILISGLVLSLVVPVSANADSLCNNGTFSSNSGRGTCSWNGGVNKGYPSYSDPGSSSYNRNNGFGGFGSTSNKRDNGFGGFGSTGKDPFTGKSCRKGVYSC